MNIDTSSQSAENRQQLWENKSIPVSSLMSRRIDLKSIRRNALKELKYVLSIYEKAQAAELHYEVIRFVGIMAAVEAHAIWERFAEDRLIAALNHHPSTFIRANDIRGIKRVPLGLATVLVRGGSRYFDFRSTKELIDRADGFLGKSANPFRRLSPVDKNYLDTLAGMRNCIVHKSKPAFTTYKRLLRQTYGIKSAPEPDEFLSAEDRRGNSPARYKSRLHGLIAVIKKTIRHT